MSSELTAEDPEVRKIASRLLNIAGNNSLELIKVHRCLERAIAKIMSKTGCNEHELEHQNIGLIDECYQNVKLTPTTTDMQPVAFSDGTAPRVNGGRNRSGAREVVVRERTHLQFQCYNNYWYVSVPHPSCSDFCRRRLIAGYGHVAPVTFYGRLFCIIFGILGVPLTLLTVADLGMFLSILLRKATTWFCLVLTPNGHCKEKMFKNPNHSESKPEVNGMILPGNDLKVQPDEEDEENSEKPDARSFFVKELHCVIEFMRAVCRKTGEAVVLGVTFVSYLVLGAKVLSVYEPEMDFFKAFYFNFVTLTTIGLGDFVPRSFDYLFVTLCYIGVGLALTTMSVELAADVLRKLHYLGRQVDNIASTVVWFGGKRITMRKLVKNLGDQFNIPKEQLENFDLNQFVDNAMKVQAGEIKTLRKPAAAVAIRDLDALSYSKIRDSCESDIRYVDERWSKHHG
ncbi:unnamed protein product [Heligmosomoides polygyrus]|uniref:Potassium channel domain-containing protein n=1 Tax=Heligmosomoides polygyrus TaxID=6339 RepID=A0A3P8CR61_HELPZ|nr:unnamed protein product [Heligmosomoides polygyrus]